MKKKVCVLIVSALSFVLLFAWSAAAEESVLLSASAFPEPDTFVESSLTEDTEKVDPAFAANPNARYDLAISGTAEFGKAQEILNYVNQLRASKGLAALSMDFYLTEAAMQRAAETAIFFSHERPDGSWCTAINPKAQGENIACGNSTSAATYDQWYNSPGHYNNMISANWKSIGIGCFKHGGTCYWVQIFSSYYVNPGEYETRTHSENRTPGISILERNTPLFFNIYNSSEENTLNLNLGEGYQLEVKKRNSGWDYGFCTFQPGSFYWNSSNPAAVIVDRNGYVTAVGSGEATITVNTVNGNGSLSCRVVSACNFQDAEVTLSKTRFTYNGQPQMPEVTVKYGNVVLQQGIDYSVSCGDHTNAGTVSMTIRGIGAYSGTRTASFTISPVSAEKVTAKLPSNNFTGYSSVWDFLDAKVVMTYKGKTLTCGTDYQIYACSTYKNKDGVSAVYINMKGNYSGSYDMYCLESAGVKDISKRTYTGKKIKPVPSVSIVIGYYTTALKEGTDFTCSYKNNTQVGTATMVIRGKGHYFGSTTKKFKIVPRIANLTSAAKTGSGSMKVTWQKNAGRITGYEIQYSTDSSFSGGSSYGTKTVRIKNSSATSKKITGLKKGRTYYVRIRTYKKVNGKFYYSRWSDAKTVW